MGIASFLFSETFEVLSMYDGQATDYMGAMLSPNYSNMQVKGTVSGRVTPGDSLEPDVQSPFKDGEVDVTSMWIGFFDIPDGFEINSGDYVRDTTDNRRFFVVQFINRMPGGKHSHHYEARLQTTELSRNSQ